MFLSSESEFLLWEENILFCPDVTHPVDWASNITFLCIIITLFNIIVGVVVLIPFAILVDDTVVVMNVLLYHMLIGKTVHVSVFDV